MTTNPLDVIEQKIATLHKGMAYVLGKDAPGTLELILGMEAKTQEAKIKRASAALSILCDMLPDVVVHAAKGEHVDDAQDAEVVQ